MSLSLPLSHFLSPAPAPPAAGRVTARCPGLLPGMWSDPVTAPCIRGPGHAGDHQDAGGYRWNDERWLD
jgi:hypothetical protein